MCPGKIFSNDRRHPNSALNMFQNSKLFLQVAGSSSDPQNQRTMISEHKVVVRINKPPVRTETDSISEPPRCERTSPRISCSSKALVDSRRSNWYCNRAYRDQLEKAPAVVHARQPKRRSSRWRATTTRSEGVAFPVFRSIRYRRRTIVCWCGVR